MSTAQPVWKFLDNLGDSSPIEYGGLFVYEDVLGVYGFEMEKLVKPCDDDRCEQCENEPDVEAWDALWEINRECDRAFETWCDEYDKTHDGISNDEFDAARKATFDKFEPQREQARVKARDDHAAWEKHVAEHERWMVYHVMLERFKIVREYDVSQCVCEHDAPYDDPEDLTWWKAHERVCPSRKVSWHMVCVSYEESWRRYGTPAQREPWFFDSLDSIADTVSTTKFALIRALCSNDWRRLALAWECILDYHGWENGDSYPLTLSRPEVEKRYEKELG